MLNVVTYIVRNLVIKNQKKVQIVLKVCVMETAYRNQDVINTASS